MASSDLIFRLIGKDVSASKSLKGMTVALAAVGAVAIKFGVDSVKAYTEAQTAQVKLQDAYDRFPALANGNIEALRDLATARSRVTRFDDDATAAAAAQLAQFGLNQRQLEKLIPLVQDYAAKTGVDLTEASGKVGKALMGNTKALKELGIAYKPTGDKAKDLTNIQKLLNEKVGGFAEKDGKSAAGQAAILANQFGEVQESLGQALLPALLKLSDMLIPLITTFNDMSDPMKTAIFVVGGLGTAFVLLAPKILAAKTLLASFTGGGGVGGAGGAVGKFSGALGKVGKVLGAAGPWGLAIGMGISALGLFGQGSEDAAQAQGAFKQALDASNGALNEQVRKTVAVEAERQGLLEQGRKLGLSEATIVAAIMGEEGARKKVSAALAAQTKAQTAVAAGGRGVVGTTTAQRDAAAALSSAIDNLTGDFSGQVAAQKRVDAAMDNTLASWKALRAALRRPIHGGISITVTADGDLVGHGTRTGRRVPALASGGIVSRPTLALIGEAGPEAVIPLSGRNAGMGMGSNQPIVVQLVTPLGKVLHEQLIDYRNQRRTGLGLG